MVAEFDLPGLILDLLLKIIHIRYYTFDNVKFLF